MSDEEVSMADYFELAPDYSAQNWLLDTPRYQKDTDLDVWSFSSGARFQARSPLCAPIQRDGSITDLCFSHYMVIYIQPRVARLLEAFAGDDVQVIPALLNSGEEIHILNVLSVVDCFDRARSEATYVRDKPNMVLRLHIEANSANEHHVLRLASWRAPLIVSELILRHLLRIGATGFHPVKVS